MAVRPVPKENDWRDVMSLFKKLYGFIRNMRLSFKLMVSFLLM
jgi:hypothetical protein